MNRALQPWEFLFITLSGWMNRHQQRVIDYLIEENRILKGKYRGKRIRFTDNERRRLAVKGKVLGRKLLKIGLHCYSRHHSRLAPETDREKVGLQLKERAWQAAGHE